MPSWLLVKAELLDMAPWTIHPNREPGRLPHHGVEWQAPHTEVAMGAREAVGATERPGAAWALHSV